MTRRWCRSGGSWRCCRRSRPCSTSTGRTATCFRAPITSSSAAPSRRTWTTRRRTRRCARTWSGTSPRCSARRRVGRCRNSTSTMRAMPRCSNHAWRRSSDGIHRARSPRGHAKECSMAFTVADYVLARLHEQQVDTLFGVPAAYCSPLFEATGGHGIVPVVTASDLEAGYAADGYARTKGLAAVAVAYGVGTLSMINAIAGAYVERSPVVVVNGGPTAANLDRLARFDVVFSHSTGR